MTSLRTSFRLTLRTSVDRKQVKQTINRGRRDLMNVVRKNRALVYGYNFRTTVNNVTSPVVVDEAENE